MKQIEIVEDEIKEGVNVRTKGDICTIGKSIDAELAQAYVDAGLAKDVETGEIGERVEGPSKVKINSAVIQTKVSK